MCKERLYVCDGTLKGVCKETLYVCDGALKGVCVRKD